MAELFEKIEDYVYGDEYAFGVPGHKRNYFENDFISEVFKRDVTCIDEFFSTDRQEGYVRNSMDEMAKMFESDESYYVPGDGSTAILIAMSSVVKPGDTILAMRSSSKMFYNVAYLLGINVIYLYGENDPDLGVGLSITIEQVEEAFEKNPSISAVYLTSPTLQGLSAEVDDIAEFAHNKNIPLIVDASNGTHFGFAEFLPDSAINSGADIVINAPFKTLPSPVGVSLLHVIGERVDIEKVRFYVDLYSGEAFSYMSYACTDVCLEKLANREFDWKAFYEKREKLSKELSFLQHIGTFEAFTPDKWNTPEIGKVLIYPKTGKINGKRLFDKLRREYGLRAQFCTPAYVLLSFTIGDSDEGFERLESALKKIDFELSEKVQTARTMASRDLGNLESLFGVKSFLSAKGNNKYPIFPMAEAKYTIKEATDLEKEAVLLLMAEGRICGCYVDIIPFSKPLLVPGEVITKEILAYINFYAKNGFDVTGIFVDRIEVLREKKSTDESQKVRDEKSLDIKELGKKDINDNKSDDKKNPEEKDTDKKESDKKDTDKKDLDKKESDKKESDKKVSGETKSDKDKAEEKDDATKKDS